MEEGVFACGPRREPVAPVVVGDPFPARYAGHCNECNTEIHKGEFIVKMSDSTYQHAVHHESSPWS